MQSVGAKSAEAVGQGGPAGSSPGRGARGLLESLGALRPVRVGFVLLQLYLLVELVARFNLENRTFQVLLGFAPAAFLLHHLLPQRLRIPFFLAVSMLGTGWVLGMESGVWQWGTSLGRTGFLVAVGLALIGICNLPVRFTLRVALLVMTGGGLAILRMGWLAGGTLGAVWPVLGAMFMFRIAIYLYDVEHEKTRPGLARSACYFFLLPNVFFPLFPVIDFKTFCRNHYRFEDLRTYQQGLEWMMRGIIHLLLWRLVYYHVYLDPVRIQDGADLVRFLLANVALYLRVSGLFHLVVGLLHLFGFGLPQTNRRYFLASSFNDYWRRMNIYWKDFIMKVVYYPTVFRMKSWGLERSIVAATLLAFGVSWLLHSYQFFWLRGDFPILAQDALFWGLLGVLVALNSVVEMRRGRQRRLGRQRRSLRGSLDLGVRTAMVFAVITLLWSLWNSKSPAHWLDLWSLADSRTLLYGLGALVLVAVAAMGFGGESGLPAPLPEALDRPSSFPWRAAALRCVAPAFAIYAVGAPAFSSLFDAEGRVVISSLSWSKPNVSDEERMQLGYYEDVMDVSSFNAQLSDALARRPASWRKLEDTEAIRPTADIRLTELVPSRETEVNGKVIRTNRWGMRDREYTQARPPGTVRIALLGSSNEMGWGLENEEVFEELVEDRLNRDLAPQTGLRYEILNFSVNGYSPIELVGTLELRVAAFEPDVVLLAAHTDDRFFVMRRFARSLREGVPPRHVFLRRLAEKTQLDETTPESWAQRRLTSHTTEMLAWAYGSIAEGARGMGAIPVWLYVERVVNANPVDEREMGALAEAAGFITISLTESYGDVDRDTLRVRPWDPHPNAAAHRLLADGLYEQLIATPGLGLRGARAGASPHPR